MATVGRLRLIGGYSAYRVDALEFKGISIVSGSLFSRHGSVVDGVV
jgi:hypothetical protein